MKYKNINTGMVKTASEWVEHIAMDDFWYHDPSGHFEEMVESGALVEVEE